MNQVKTKIGFNNTVLSGRGVSVAVLDSGIDINHPDFQKRILTYKDFTNSNNSFKDEYGHGTHVCGCIGGDGKMSQGIFKGMAPKCCFVVAKVLDKKGFGHAEDMIKAIQWVINMKNEYHIRILNISIGTGMNHNGQLYGAIVKILNLAWAHGILIICAAGNAGPAEKSISEIGMSSQMITVGCHDGYRSFNHHDYCQLFSSRGDPNAIIRKPDIVAPGSEIVSCRSLHAKQRFYSNRYYCKKSGTSMSTAIVSGIAALYFEKFPQDTNEQFKNKLICNAKDLGEPWNKQGYGLVQPAKMMLT